MRRYDLNTAPKMFDVVHNPVCNALASMICRAAVRMDDPFQFMEEIGEELDAHLTEKQREAIVVLTGAGALTGHGLSPLELRGRTWIVKSCETEVSIGPDPDHSILKEVAVIILLSEFPCLYYTVRTRR